MNLRKNPEKDVRRFSGLFFQIGLLSALLITVSAFEWSSPEEKPVVNDPDTLFGEDDIFPPITEIEEKKPPKPKKIQFIEVKKEDPEEPVPEDLVPDIMAPPVNEPSPETLPEIKENVDDEPVPYTDEMPTPVGGYDAFYGYVAKNITYTRQARNLHLQGKVFVQFVVDKDGRITQVEVVRGLGAGLDEEARKVMENSPAWNPGRQSGRRVKVRMIIPIHFKLQ